MTTFEIIVAIGIIAIVGLKILDFTGAATTYVKMKEGFECLAKKVECCESQLGRIRSATQDIKTLTDIVDKMHRNLCVEIADKMVDRAYPPTYAMPCYAPDGTCVNPHGDCINCPVRDGATLSTPARTIKVKGKRCELTDEELMKRINEDNKED